MNNGDRLSGIIIKGIAGFYYVKVDEGDIIECHARGKFRKDKLRPLVGDHTEIEIVDAEKKIGSIVDIKERSSVLIRPEVANANQAMVVFACSHPEPNLGLLDRFLIMMEKQNVRTVVCFNKTDLADDKLVDNIREIYRDSDVAIIAVSARDNIGLEAIHEALKGKITVLAGPSGVGKSTITNIIFPEAFMETGDISAKLDRGKHTTRHSQLFQLEEDTYIMDTPGFTSFELMEGFEAEEIKEYYPEFYKVEESCRFDSCSHTHEPGCKIKAAVESGAINKIRYDGYCNIYEEIKNRRKYK